MMENVVHGGSTIKALTLLLVIRYAIHSITLTFDKSCSELFERSMGWQQTKPLNLMKWVTLAAPANTSMKSKTNASGRGTSVGVLASSKFPPTSSSSCPTRRKAVSTGESNLLYPPLLLVVFHTTSDSCSGTLALQ